MRLHPACFSVVRNCDGVDAPDGICVPRWWCRPLEEASVGQANTIGLDIAKRVFQAHGADASGRVVFRKRLVRAKVLEFFAAQPPCRVAMEACAGAHHWARELGKLGHTVRLIPPAYVKPFVKRQKNDMADAEAICEAAQRPSMRFVPVKTEEQQANGVVFRARDLLVRQRTQCINALRGHLSEYGYVFPQGITHAEAVIAHVEDPASSVPESARAVLNVLIGTFQALEAQIQALDAEIIQRAKADPVARRLMTIPGIGPIAATAIMALVPAPEGFRAGRDFAAWLGLTPLQKSTGGKQRLGAISKMGERTIRRLLILGASAVVRWAGQRGTPAGSWLARMLARKPKCWSPWPWPTRRPALSGPCWSRGAFIGLQPRPRKRAGAARAWGERKEGMAQRSARRGRDNQCATPYREYAALIWTRSANSHTGPRRFAAAPEAGQMAASDHAPRPS